MKASKPRSPLRGAWKWPVESKKAHWFATGDARSICSKWVYTGPSLPTQETLETPGPDDCAACFRLARSLGAEPENG